MFSVKIIQNYFEVELPFKLNEYKWQNSILILEHCIHSQYEIIINVSLFIYR